MCDFVQEKVALGQVPPPHPNICIFHCQYYSTDVAVTRTNGQSLGTFQKAMLFRNTGSIG